MTNKKKNIEFLIARLEDLPEYDPTNQENIKIANKILKDTKIIIRNYFGIESPYYKLLKNIGFTPKMLFFTADNRSGSLRDEKYTWGKAQKALNSLLHDMLKEIKVIGE